MSISSITIQRPDDWHVHLRDGPLLGAVLAATSDTFGRAIVMPNLKPPVTTASQAEAYRRRIRTLLPPTSSFEPLMTCYLTDTIAVADLRAGYQDGIFTAAKLYPAGATTNSEAGVSSITRLHRVLDTLQDLGMPLLVHGEVVDSDVDVFDREAVFIERTLTGLRRDYPELKIVFEHVTTTEAVQFVESAGRLTAATITPHHLLVNRNAMFSGGIRPHMYCLPVAKREHHRRALRRAATSGNPQFFLGTDSAPHLRIAKEHECGCAGVFNAPTAMACYAQVFADEFALDKLEGFASRHGPEFYGLPVNDDTITLQRDDTPPVQPIELDTPDGGIRIFHANTPVHWRIV